MLTACICGFNFEYYCVYPRCAAGDKGKPPNTGSGVQSPVYQPQPKGCICPPTSEQTCMATDCPRRPYKVPSEV